MLNIVALPSYITSNSFNLSCSQSGGASAQFSVSKNGGSQIAFGPSINLSTSPCLVQVTSSEVNDQTSYTFTVTVSDGDNSQSDSTSTFYDISGPSPVSGYSKERINSGTYKLHWTNPGDSDFEKVVIYRSDSQGFSADSGHEIARVSGGSNSAMTYDDYFSPDASKTYYYAIRALDKAGNSSSLVGDAGSSTSSTTTTPASPKPSSQSGGAANQTVTLPQDNGKVLAAETTPSSSPSASETPAYIAPQAGGLINFLLTHKKIAFVFVFVIGAFGFFLAKRKQK